MTIDELKEKFPQKIQEIKDFMEDDAKDIIGVEAVEFYKDSFNKEGATDKQLTKWADVKRRDPNSPWHGHSGQTGKKNKLRETAKILPGETGELRNATTYTKTATGVRISNDKPYAAVHNFGGKAYVYGKKSFQMIARPFIYRSETLNNELRRILIDEIKSILNK
ncbi:MAG: phage virion morphogenesis protein [Mangrovibacterium sp.]